MVKISLYLLNVVFLLVFNSAVLCSQDTVIVGKAHHAKYGAAVVSSHDQVYYIDKLASWSSDMYEKNVKVAGRIVVRRVKKRTNTISGSINGPDIKIIMNPKIQILPDS